MNENETKKHIEEIKLFTKRIKTKKQARDFLQKTGVYTKHGNLKRAYR